ncbi:ring-hydroxylating dioxygenase, large terminal subunit [Caulobacter sp. AP07]|uniref:aromatic ring-hydroxylating oxygenase subunit alpha n=1 Tax=Caulobacter sp. AP07 TaxID=1144304 RepID=UPI000271E8D3|nr:SRPBCC family protein [Caulobacter sp. AP07]EJL30782.1 ring-hydroxylating dioxygenase, large terminal subunit [Caulobacter sp. AP07]
MSSVSQSHGTGLTAAQIAAVRAPLSRASLLPATVYSDPEIFRLEKERIFARTWLPVCHISQIREPGSFVSRQLAGEAIMALRGREGEIRVMSNVCRHRNTTLVDGEGQCKGNRIICPYHGWTYGLDGQLLAAPFMDQAEDFARREIKLPEFRHEVWHGFVFVNFDADAQSLAEQMVEFEPLVAPYRYEDMEAFEMRRSTVPWNWKISLENFSEAYHQPWVHTNTAEKGFPAALAEYLDANGPYSAFFLPEEKGEHIKTFTPPHADMPDAFLRRVMVFNVYPYMHALTDPATPIFLDFNIKNENEHELVWHVLLPKGSSQKPDILDDVKLFGSFIEPVLLEDISVCTGVGRGVQSRFVTQGRLSHMEKPLHQFHNWWLDHMLVENSERIAAE